MSPRNDVPSSDPKSVWLTVLKELTSTTTTVESVVTDVPKVTDDVDDEVLDDDVDDDVDDEVLDDVDSSGGGGKSAGYDPSSGQYLGRPKKPSTLKGTDEAGDPLTAHHLYPWNQLRANLNDALLDPSGAKMKKVLAFAQHTPPTDFYTELANTHDKRCTDFTGWVNEAAKALCWGPANIFMGPLNNKRGDDPGEKIDVSRMKSGLMTPASAVADLLAQQGGISKASKLTELLARNVREAQVDESGTAIPRPYDKQDWESDTTGKRVQREGVHIKEGGGNISVEDDMESGWTPAPKTTKGSSKKTGPTTPKLTEEEIQRLRDEAEKRRLAREKPVDEVTDDPDSSGGLGGLFGDDNEVTDDEPSDSGLGGLFGGDDD